MPAIKRLYLAVGLLLLCASLGPGNAAVPTLAQADPAETLDGYTRADRLGITFISSVDTANTEERYQRALELGAGWNRWPLYWDRVETEEGEFNWRAYDALVQADLDHGLKTNVVLLGVPAFHRDEDSV